MSKKNLAFWAIILEAIIVGVSIPIIKDVLKTIPPWTLAFIRFTIASFLSLIFVDFRNIRFGDIKKIAVLAFFGVTLNVGLFAVGLTSTSAIDATLIFTLGPAITSAVAVVWIKERIIPTHIFGIGVACLGALIYTTYPFLVAKQVRLDLLGDFWVLVAVAAGAIFAVGSKNLFETYKASTIVSVSFLVGALSFLPFSLYEASTKPFWIQGLNPFLIGEIIFLSVGLAFLGNVLYEFGLTKIDVHTVSIIGYFSPAISVLIAAYFLHEKINMSFIPSVFLIVAGIFLVLHFHPHPHPQHHHRRHRV